MPKRNAKSDHMQRKSPTWDCESDGGEDGERVRLLPKPRTPSKAEWERHVVSHMPFRDRRRHVWPGGVSNVGIRGIRGTMTNIRLCALIMGI